MKGVPKRVLPYVVSAALFAGLLLLVDARSLHRVFAVRDFGPLLLGAAFYVLTLGFRAARYKVLVAAVAGGRSRLASMWHIVTIGSFSNHVMPFRSGEAVFVFLTTFTNDVPAARGTAALLAARVYDLLTVLIVTAAAAASMGISSGAAWVPFVLPAVFFLLFAAVRLDLFLRLAAWATDRSFRLARLHRTRPAVLLTGFVSGLHRDLAGLRSPRLVLLGLLTSCGLWISLGAAFRELLAAFNHPMPLDTVIVGSVGAVLTNVLPVNALGNIGTLEAGWTLGFVAVGMDRADAVATGLAMHAVTIVVSGLFAALSLAVIGRPTWRAFRDWRRRERGPGESSPRETAVRSGTGSAKYGGEGVSDRGNGDRDPTA